MLLTLLVYWHYGSDAGAWLAFGALVLGVMGGWILLARVAARLLASENSLVEVSGVLLSLVLVVFAVFVAGVVLNCA
jgi:hypothetical protein